MTELFFELIRIAIGTQERLSRVPSKKEWGRLFKMAERQRLLGICFYGVKKVASPKYDNEASPKYDNDNDYDYDQSTTTIPGELYDYWLGTAALIQQQNQKVNNQCLEVSAKFQEAGIRYSILKGQGIAQLYNEGRKTKDERQNDSNSLGMFRQPGDIDVYVDCGREKAIEFADSIGQENAEWDYKHLHLKMFKDTEVEVHYRVEVLLNLWKNRKLQKWFKKHEEDMFSQQGGLITPTIEFNLFYILLHIYRHFLYEGVGLRQLLDYFFVLQEYEKSEECRVKSEELVDLLRQFGMLRFAQGVMWVLMHVFECQNESLTPTPSPEGKGIYDNDKPTPNPHPSLHSPSRSLPLKGRENLNWRERYPWMIVKPLESEGRFILHEVMQGGNFGKFDKRIKKGGKRSKLQAVSAVLQHNLHLLKHYPSDVIWAPIWIVYHWGWKKATVLKSNV